ncbi:hypothetical protein [Nocardia brasiliensis]|uniref:hypothetical protein n=1 Tax=Nocardia brasiliensis TaxID=37326 RepID=UPI00189564CA|nr:hypothetical protein [Nocardia brasiliensis]MBF6125116.1 hypothetical protein [Nocardia brasiliensis]
MIIDKARIATAAIALTGASLFGAVATVATVAPAVAAPSIARTAAPSAGELTAKMQIVLNRGASRADRAAELEAGEAGLPIVDQVAAIIATLPSYRWSIIGPVNVQGDTLTAQLKTAVEGYDNLPLAEMSWKQIDGKWKLSNTSLCTIAGFASLPCNV